MIGVVIPFHNQYSHIQGCIESVFDQHSVSHIVVVDDGSDIPFVQYLPRLGVDVKIIRLWENKGVQRARNVGWHWLHTQTDVEMFMFCDADVVWKRGAFQYLENALMAAYRRDGYVGYAYCDYERTGAVTGDWKAIPWDDVKLKAQNYISTMSLVFRKALPTPPFVEDEQRLQDWSLWLRMLKNGRKGVYVDRTLFSAFYDTDSISVRSSEDYVNWHDLISKRYT